jgi:hypothetical protein
VNNLIVQGSDQNPITAQMIFNAAWQRFIIEQAPPAVHKPIPSEGYSNRYLCSYLTEDGKKCAVGLCIPDGHPIQQCNTALFYLIAGQYNHLFNLKESENTLQFELHDSLVNSNTGEWTHSLLYRKQAYIEVAKKFSLKVPDSNE